MQADLHTETRVVKRLELVFTEEEARRFGFLLKQASEALILSQEEQEMLYRVYALLCPPKTVVGDERPRENGDTVTMPCDRSPFWKAGDGGELTPGDHVAR